ncbi:uncharacterized protein [Haliotis cracherodii]|uniref:uncharacterized protein n=1 Tax=Haliotis cracherodii TaxID=6455 RepID=UPI0039E7D8BC
MGSNRPHTSPISLSLTENQPSRQVNSMAPSPVDLNEMAPWLRQYARVNYKDANYLWVGFSFGFRLEFQGSRTGRLARNLRSATHQDTAGYVKQKLQKEVDLGRMAGPFKDTPLDNLQVSPIGLVPKKQPGYGQHLAGTSHFSDNLNGCVNTLEQLGVPIAHDKTVGPTTKLIFLGLEIDTIAMQIRIPESKIKEATREIQDILSTGNIKVTKRALQSLIGKLNFMCRAIPMARAFSRRLIDLLSKGKQPFHHIRITSWVKEDLQMWLTFLTSYNGISVFQYQRWVDSDFLQLFSDAAGGAGFGAYMQGKWFNGAWPPQWVTDGTTRDLTLLELFPITLAIQIWGKQLANKKVLFYCDNQAVVTIINKQSTKAPRVMSLLRQLILQCLRYNIMFKAKYVCSTANTIADALSWFQLNNLPHVCSSAYEARLFKAVYCTAFFGFFRVSELVQTGPSKTGCAIQNLSCSGNPQQLSIHLPHSKSDQYRMGTTVTMSSIPGNPLCPVVAFKHYLEARPSGPQHAFVHFDHSPVTRYQFQALLKKALAHSNINTARYSSHSTSLGQPHQQP